MNTETSEVPTMPVAKVTEAALEDPLLGLYAVAAVACVAIGTSQAMPPGPPSNITPFHSATVPPISLVAYAKRLVKYAKCGHTGLALGLVLMGRYTKTKNEPVCRLTSHRLLLASVVVAVKAHYDIFYSNAYYAQVGGITTKEMNKLELALLEGLKFSAMVSADEVADLLPGLASAGQTVLLDGDGNPDFRQHQAQVLCAGESAAFVLAAAPRLCRALSGPSSPVRRQGLSPAGRSPPTVLTSNSADFGCYRPSDGHDPSPFDPSMQNVSPGMQSGNYVNAQRGGLLHSRGGSSAALHTLMYAPASLAVSRRSSNASQVPTYLQPHSLTM